MNEQIFLRDYIPSVDDLLDHDITEEATLVESYDFLSYLYEHIVDAAKRQENRVECIARAEETRQFIKEVLDEYDEEHPEFANLKRAYWGERK